MLFQAVCSPFKLPRFAQEGDGAPPSRPSASTTVILRQAAKRRRSGDPAAPKVIFPHPTHPPLSRYRVLQQHRVILGPVPRIQNLDLTDSAPPPTFTSLDPRHRAEDDASERHPFILPRFAREDEKRLEKRKKGAMVGFGPLSRLFAVWGGDFILPCEAGEVAGCGSSLTEGAVP